MFTWWESLSIVSQIFVCIAAPATLVLLIQTVMMFIGIGDDAADGLDSVEILSEGSIADGDGVFGEDIVEVDADVSGLDGLRIFTVRGIVAFMVVFGWVGLVLDRAGVKLWISLPAAVASGFVMMLILALLMRWVMSLRNDGNIDNRNALGTSGTVYLTVPAARSGTGKVNVLIQGSYVERDAVTDESQPIPTGMEIVVIGISGQTTLVVKRK